jgi:anti-anti-sigma regulatory factor
VPLFDIPVVMPYRLRDERDGALFSVQVNAVASNEASAVAATQVLVRSLGLLKHRGRTVEVLPERVKIGAMGRQIEGPYAYVLTHGSLIHHLDFPSRIDSQSGEVMGDAFTGLDPALLLGVVMDCNPLTYINTSGLASIAAHAKRIHLRLFRVSDPVRRVFQIVGLVQLLRIFPDLRSALDDLHTPQPAIPASRAD